MDPDLKTDTHGRDNRRYQRRSAPSVGLVNVYALGQGRRKFLRCSLLQDISDGGVGIRTDVALPKGTAGFLIGLEFVKEPL